MIAAKVWGCLGDVKMYIEPFFGSGAVLLQRPATSLRSKIYEVVNDKDGFIANVWRAIQFDPDEVAKWCDWPVNHADLVARRKVLIASEGRLLEGLTGDPEWFDAKLAGYWVWAASCWIGSGLTLANITPQPNRPHLSSDTGIHSKVPLLDHDKGVHSSNNVYKWMGALNRRLRHVKVVCGDWRRVCGGHWQAMNGTVGMFFDPPYAVSNRNKKLYHHDSLTIAKDVEKWVLERGTDARYRIVVCGYDNEYEELQANGWTIHAWKAVGGYSKKGTRGMKNRHRERLYISPYCLKKSMLSND